jgi:hypothetical protein
MWRYLPREDQQRAVEVAEAFADEQCDPAKLARARDRARQSYDQLVQQHIREGRPRDQEATHVQLAAHAAGWKRRAARTNRSSSTVAPWGTTSAAAG